MADSTIQTIEIDAEPEACFAVAADFASYPDWATGVKQVEILEVGEDGRASRVRFVVDGMVKEISYVLVYEYHHPGEMRWTAEPGDDIDEMIGSYRFDPLDDAKTEVVYALRAVPSFNIPGFLRRQAEKQVVGTALRGLRKRVEEIAAG